VREVGFGVIRMTDPPVLCYKGTDRVEVPENQEERYTSVPAKPMWCLLMNEIVTMKLNKVFLAPQYYVRK
jgi:hypothetical protein